MMVKMRIWLDCRQGAGLTAAAGLLCLALATGSQAATDPQGQDKGTKKPVQVLEVCPIDGPCQTQGESSPSQTPERITGQATNERGKVKQPVKSQQKPKSE